MNQITVSNLSIQFDADQITSGDDKTQAEQALDLINALLQREPFGLAAQIFRPEGDLPVFSENIDIDP